MGFEATCRDSVRPLGCGMWTRKTSLTLVFFLPMSVSPFRSSMSEFLSFRIPAQSTLLGRRVHACPSVPDVPRRASPPRPPPSPPGPRDSTRGRRPVPHPLGAEGGAPDSLGRREEAAGRAL